MKGFDKNFISLAKATEYCKYSLPYLNLRIRQGKLKAVKFGRNWMTTKEWIDDYVRKIESQNKKYISLSQATNYCPYSLPYLNLRIRQGKLKAVKFGRNWMTTKEWIDDYLKISRKQNGICRAPSGKPESAARKIFLNAGLKFFSAALAAFAVVVFSFNVFLLKEKIPAENVFELALNLPAYAFKTADPKSCGLGADMSKSLADFFSASREYFDFKIAEVQEDFSEARRSSTASISSFLKSLEKYAAFFLKPWQEKNEYAASPASTPLFEKVAVPEPAKEVIKETVKVVRVEGTNSYEYLSLYGLLSTRIAALEARPVAGPTFANTPSTGAALSSSVFANGYGMSVSGFGSFTTTISAPVANVSTSLTAGRVALDSASTFIDSNNAGNMTFEDAISGSWTLAQLIGGGGGGLGANLSSLTNDILSNNGSLVLGGTGGAFNENLSLNFESASNTVAFSSSTGATLLDFGAFNSVSTGTGTFGQIIDSGLTNTRVPYANASKQLVDSANLTFDGTTLTAGGFSTSGNGVFSGSVTTGQLRFNDYPGEIGIYFDNYSGGGTFTVTAGTPNAGSGAQGANIRMTTGAGADGNDIGVASASGSITIQVATGGSGTEATNPNGGAGNSINYLSGYGGNAFNDGSASGGSGGSHIFTLAQGGLNWDGSRAQSGTFLIQHSGAPVSSPYFRVTNGATDPFTVNADGSSTFSGQVLISNGSAAVPAIAFADETNTGIYQTANNMAFTIAGTARATLSATGLTAAGFGISNVTNALAGGVRLGDTGVYGWAETGQATTMDLGLSRGAVGLLYVGNGTAADKSGSIEMTGTGTFGSSNQAVLGSSGSYSFHGTDGVTTVDLNNGTYALNIAGDSYVADGSINMFTADPVIMQTIVNGDGYAVWAYRLGGVAGYFYDGTNIAQFATGGYAINGVGDTLMVGDASYQDITASGSLVIDTNTLVVNASGYTDKVGIGTATPSSLLTLAQNPANNAWFGMEVDDTSGTSPTFGNAKIGIMNAADSTYSIGGIWFGQATPSFTNYAFMGDGSAYTLFNTPAGAYMNFRVGNTTQWSILSTGNFVSGADGTGTQEIITLGGVSGANEGFLSSDYAFQARGGNPNIRIDVERASGGFAANFFDLYATDTTSSTEARLGQVGVYGSFNADPAAPTVSWLYFGANDSATAYADAPLRVYPDYVRSVYDFYVGAAAADTDYSLRFDGQTTDGIMTWMEDEDYFLFGDDVVINSGESLTVDTNTLVVNAAGYTDKVGIGTATPLGKLDITSGNNASGGGGSNIALQYYLGGYRNWITTDHNAGSTSNRFKFWLNNSATAGGSSAPGTGNELMFTLDNSGAIIGSGVAGKDYTLTFDGESDDGVITYDEDNNLFNLADTGITTTGLGTLGSLVVDTTTLVANASGYTDKVGIGTATPASALHLAGTTSAAFGQFDIGIKLSAVTRPPAFTVAQVADATGLIPDGTYWYYISYVTAYGETELTGDGGSSEFYGNYGEPGASGIVVDAAHKKVDVSVTASTDYRVTGIKIYRSTAGSFFTAFLVDTISNTTQTYTDNKATTSGVNVIVRENTTNGQIFYNTSRALLVGGSTTLLGSNAGRAITTGGNNTIFGADAGLNVTTGGSNVLVGFGAGRNNNISASIGIGQWALYNSNSSHNIAIGSNALFSATGYFNTAIGIQAGAVATGTGNTFLGYQSGVATTTGGYNIYLGYLAGAKETTEANQLIVGNQAYADKATEQANSIIFGTMAAAAAAQTFRVNAGTINFNAGVDTDLTMNFTGTTNSGVLKWMEDEDYFQSDDNVNVVGSYYVSGTPGVTDTYDDGIDSQISFTGGIATAISTSFNSNTVSNKTELVSVLDKIDAIKAYTYEYDGNLKFGFLADEISQVFPEATFIGRHDEEIGYRKDAMLAIVMKAVQELNDKLDLLVEKIGLLGDAIETSILSLKEVVADKITAKTVIIENLAVKTVRLERMEMVDQKTGDIYCSWIEDGEIKKAKGECGGSPQPSALNNSGSNNSPETNSPLNLPDAEIGDNASADTDAADQGGEGDNAANPPEAPALPEDAGDSGQAASDVSEPAGAPSTEPAPPAEAAPIAPATALDAAPASAPAEAAPIASADSAPAAVPDAAPAPVSAPVASE